MTSSSTSAAARRYAVVGAGARAAMYVDALAGEYADVGRIVALCDTNATRMRFHSERLRAAGHPSPTTYGPEGFAQLLDAERPEVVVVTSPDHTHHRYAVAALEAGCEVIVEKPLTTSVEGARAIAQAAATSSGELIVTFNYRYAPRNRVLREVVADGRIGEVTSVHFEWVLDTVHGADYFRRWHRDKEHSGGLLVHKASHHFDLVNWWIDDVPTRVYAAGALRFYGDDNARARGLGERPARSAGSPGLATDPFALDLAADDTLKRLYLDAEVDDGYVRDQDVFAPGITIEDNLAVLATYMSGALLTYSLNAHAPWEGYRVSVNGTEGRAELEVVERSHVASPSSAALSGRPAVDPSVAPDAPGGGDRRDERPAGHRLVVQRHWEPAVEVAIPAGEGGHGGGDAQLLADLFRPSQVPDPLGRRAGYLDGLRSVAVGVAGNRSIETGAPVDVASLGFPVARTQVSA
jgi:predicted dehydrogenase